MGAPAKYRSPIESKILCLTNSSLNLKPSLLSILFSPTTTALSKDPPSAKPIDLSLSTSFSKPKVLAAAISVL